MKNFKQSAGLTLIELMVTIAIAAILIAVAAPSFTNMVENSRAQSVTGRLESTFVFARSEAVDGVENIYVCPTVDFIGCLDANDWSQGWLIYDGGNNGDDNDAGGDDNLLRVEDIGSLRATLLAVTLSAADITSVCFNSVGRECDGQTARFPVVAGGGTSTLRLDNSGVVRYE